VLSTEGEEKKESRIVAAKKREKNSFSVSFEEGRKNEEGI